MNLFTPRRLRDARDWYPNPATTGSSIPETWRGWARNTKLVGAEYMCTWRIGVHCPSRHAVIPAWFRGRWNDAAVEAALEWSAALLPSRHVWILHEPGIATLLVSGGPAPESHHGAELRQRDQVIETYMRVFACLHAAIMAEQEMSLPDLDAIAPMLPIDARRNGMPMLREVWERWTPRGGYANFTEPKGDYPNQCHSGEIWSKWWHSWGMESRAEVDWFHPHGFPGFGDPEDKVRTFVETMATADARDVRAWLTSGQAAPWETEAEPGVAPLGTD